jgi:hypothetical protein
MGSLRAHARSPGVISLHLIKDRLPCLCLAAAVLGGRQSSRRPVCAEQRCGESAGAVWESDAA